MIRSMLCALVMFLGFIVAPTSAYPTGKVVEVTEADFDAQVAKGPTLVDVYADWCGREFAFPPTTPRLPAAKT